MAIQRLAVGGLVTIVRLRVVEERPVIGQLPTVAVVEDEFGCVVPEAARAADGWARAERSSMRGSGPTS